MIVAAGASWLLIHLLPVLLVIVVALFIVGTVNPAVRWLERHHFRRTRAIALVFVSMFEHHLSPAILPALRGLPTVLGISDYKCICPIAKKLLPDGSICRVRAGWVCCREGCVSLPHWLRDRPRYALLRTGLDLVDRVLACSRWMQRELAEAGIPSQCVTLPIPAPTPAYRRTPSGAPVFQGAGAARRLVAVVSAMGEVLATGGEVTLTVLVEPRLDALVAALRAAPIEE